MYPGVLYLMIQIDFYFKFFKYTGLVNAILFISTRRILPDTTALPQFTTPRSNTMSGSEAKFGVTPFSFDTSPSSRSNEDSEKKGEEDFEAVSLESLPHRQPINRTESGAAPHIHQQQDSYTYSGGITVPSLAFSYPN